jgi:hypothetical protein
MNQLKRINDDHNRIGNKLLDVILMMMMMIDQNEEVALDVIEEAEDGVMMMEVKKHDRVKM